MIDEKRIMAYNIKEVSKTRLKICGSIYKVSSCIFHHGFNIEKGNYSGMMRNGASSWDTVNDQKIWKSPWPRNVKDAYILFLAEDR